MADAKKIAIIGGGAAGLAASIAAAREVKRTGACADVVVFERDDRVGRSILATGNGRCNFSNANPDAAFYHNASFVGAVFEAVEREYAEGGNVTLSGGFSQNAVLRFFDGLGLLWREESEGRLYPMANKATSVLSVLRDAMRALGVQEAPSQRAVRIDVPDRKGGRYHVRFDDGRVEHADAVIVACGGVLARGLLPESVPMCDAVPVLGPLATDGPVKSLDSIRVKCVIELHGADGRVKARETGEVLFRKYGVSGIAVFNVSRVAEPKDELVLDFLPQVPTEDCEAFLVARARRLRETFGEDGAHMGQLLCGMLLPQVADVLLHSAGVDERDQVSGEHLRALAYVLKGFRLTVRGIGDARQCQVHRGGVLVSAVDDKSLQVQGLPGLYVAGEALDTDAPCGGFNLHWAWASGLLAGCAAARSALGASRGGKGSSC